MQRFWETVFDTLTGAAIKGAEVWVFDAATNSAVTIYADKAGTSDAGNPLTSDGNGYVEGYLPDALYNIEFRFEGATLRTINDVAIFDLATMRSDVDSALASISDINTALLSKLDASVVSAFGHTLVGEPDAAGVRTLLDLYTKEQVDSAISTAVSGVSGATQHYHFGAFAVASIQSSEILMDHAVATANTLGANFPNLQVSVGTPPAATWAADVQKNGASVGTISIDNTGAVTKTTAGGAAVALAAGDVVTVVAPAVADASIARLRFTFKGTI